MGGINPILSSLLDPIHFEPLVAQQVIYSSPNSSTGQLLTNNKKRAAAVEADKQRESKKHQHETSAADEQQRDQQHKRKPGRKLATTEPANKRTAQNRAAQRAFRERKDRYVKELEQRVQELEAATNLKPDLDSPLSVLEENRLLKARLETLESENVLLKNMAFSFDFPQSSDVSSASGRSVSPPKNDSTPDLFPHNSDTEDSSPVASCILEDPASPSDSIMQSLQQQPILTNVNSNTAPNTTITNQLHSMLSGSPAPSAETSTLASFGIDLNAPIFKVYRDSANGTFNPYSPDYISLLTQQNGFMGPSIGDDEFSDFLANIVSPTTASPSAILYSQFDASPSLDSSDLTNPSSPQLGLQAATSVQENFNVGILQPCYNKDGTGPLDGIKPIVQEAGLSLDELCEIFKVKAQCSEMVVLQNRIMEAAQSGDKEEVLDLVNICNEKRKMHYLRMKAGVTVLPPNYEYVQGDQSPHA